MIVDCHTQVWEPGAITGAVGVLDTGIRADAARHFEALQPVDRAIVLGFKSAYLATEISNRFVADYVKKHASKLIGFAGLDPTLAACLDELDEAQEKMGFKGVTISPALQNFHPCDTRAGSLYEECVRRRMPVVFEQSLRNSAARLEFARPLLLDEVAREFPELRIVIAHMGYPWVDETIVLLGKHRNVFADISGLVPQPWRSYNALMAAYEYGVMDKLLFGSDFPYRSPAACIEALYSINQISLGTNLVTIPRERLRCIVERDTLTLLGIEKPRSSSRQAPSPIVDDE